jgi:hypothetical protein
MHDSERTSISVASAWSQRSLWKSGPEPTRQISLMAVAALDNAVGHLTFAEKFSDPLLTAASVSGSFNTSPWLLHEAVQPATALVRAMQPRFSRPAKQVVDCDSGILKIVQSLLMVHQTQSVAATKRSSKGLMVTMLSVSAPKPSAPSCAGAHAFECKKIE